MHRRKGFTLVELLVVISIVAVMIGLLLPSLGEAREHAKRIKCQSGIRQTFLSVGYYLNDWDGYYPGMERNWTPGWSFHRFPYHSVLARNDYATGYHIVAAHPGGGVTRTNGVFDSGGGCPEGPARMDLDYQPNAYRSPENPHITYGLNPTLQTGYGRSSPTPPWSVYYAGRFNRSDYRIQQHADRTPLLIDSVTPWKSTDVYVEAYEGLRSTLAANVHTRGDTPRHRGEGLNTVLVDGTVHWVERDLVVNSWSYPKNSVMFGWRFYNMVSGLDQ